MKYTGIKYFAAIFLILLFTFKGLVNVLPLFIDYVKDAGRQEMPLAAKAETAEENGNERVPEVKEFTAGLFNDYISCTNYKTLVKKIPAREYLAEVKVFLPINTPPPKMSI